MSLVLLDTVIHLLSENCFLQQQIYQEEFGEHVNARDELLLSNVIEMLAAKKQRLEDRLACLKENKLAVQEE
jgi:hypothetical protein